MPRLCPMLRLSWAKSLDYFLTNNVRARQWPLNSSLAARTRQAVHQPATRHPNVVRSAVGRIEHHDPPRAAWILASALGLMGLRPRRFILQSTASTLGRPRWPVSSTPLTPTAEASPWTLCTITLSARPLMSIAPASFAFECTGTSCSFPRSSWKRNQRVPPRS